MPNKQRAKGRERERERERERDGRLLSNLEGCVSLLSAEEATLQGKKGKVCKSLCEEAISSSVRGGFYQNAALACERYADYLFNEEHDTDGADSLLFQAIDYYSRWGAAKKVEILQERLRRKFVFQTFKLLKLALFFR